MPVAEPPDTYPSFEALYKDIGPELFIFAFARLRVRAEAEDAIQDAFLGIWQHWDFESCHWPRDRLRKHLFVVARRRCDDHLRRRTTRDKAYPTLALPASAVFNLEEEVLNRANVRRLLQAIAELGPTNRDIVTLRLIHGPVVVWFCPF